MELRALFIEDFPLVQTDPCIFINEILIVGFYLKSDLMLR